MKSRMSYVGCRIAFGGFIRIMGEAVLRNNLPTVLERNQEFFFFCVVESRYMI